MASLTIVHITKTTIESSGEKLLKEEQEENGQEWIESKEEQTEEVLQNIKRSDNIEEKVDNHFQNKISCVKQKNILKHAENT